MKTESKEAERKEIIGNASERASTAPLTGRVTEAAHDTVDRISGNAAKAEQRVRGAVADGEEQLREKRAEARDSTEKAIEQVREYARENPLMAAGIAFASGLLVSRMVGR